jgi:hypothetical protein
MSETDNVRIIKKAAHKNGSFTLKKSYLQFAQLQLEPQLQFSQLQFGLLHFTLFAVRMVLFVFVTDFMIVIFNCF